MSSSTCGCSSGHLTNACGAAVRLRASGSQDCAILPSSHRQFREYQQSLGGSEEGALSSSSTPCLLGCEVPEQEAAPQNVEGLKF